MSWTPDQSPGPYQSPLSDSAQPPAWQAPEIKHSGLGIMSLILAFVSGLGVFLTLVAAGVLDTTTPGGVADHQGIAVAIGMAIIGFAGLALLGFGLGCAALIQSDRKKIFPILGTILNGLVVLSFCGIMAFGVAVQRM